MTREDLLRADLERALERGEEHLRALAGERVFLTGATGFVGAWLLRLLCHADERLGLGARYVVLTRRPAAFIASSVGPWVHPAVELVEGDVREFVFPPGAFSFVVHAAASSDDAWNRRHPEELVDTIVSGMARVVDFAEGCDAVRLLCVSSGAVYGLQPQGLPGMAEDFAGAPGLTGTADAAYAESKRTAEVLAFLAAARGVEPVVARLFACYGPLLPLDSHFALGNFVRDALLGGPIIVRGDGRATRSYLYGSDLARGLVACLVAGSGGQAYNVGASNEVTMRELATVVAAAVDPPAPVRVLGERLASNRYVPNVERARAELGFVADTPLPKGIASMVRWARAR
jgi:nucleoside-diphosphate-sugar epimerase